MAAAPETLPGPPLKESAFIVVDVQRLFFDPTPWHVPAMSSIFPPLKALLRAAGARTIFTRFRTPPRAEDASGSWQTYYRRWRDVLAERLPERLFHIVPEVAACAPEAIVCDKFTYSAFEAARFREALARLRPRHLVMAGVETDVCVLATLFGAVDRGFPVWLVRDAVASADAAASDAVLDTLLPRLPEQVHIVTSHQLLAAWAGEPEAGQAHDANG